MTDSKDKKTDDKSDVFKIGDDKAPAASKELREELPDFEVAGQTIENENDPTQEIGLSNEITDNQTKAAADDAVTSEARIHDLHDAKLRDGLSDEEVEEQLARGHGDPEGTIIPERGSADFNRLNG